MTPRIAFVVVGHVDHGKSTLVGRLLADTGALRDGALDKVRRICEEQHKPFEWAFLLDALEEEQVQGVTIDVTQVRFRWGGREYLIIDAPGHKEFVKNMISGAAHADAAVLLVDAREGVQEQSRRHAYLVSFLGVRSVVVAINKMDLVGYSAEAFDRLAGEYRAFLHTIDVQPAALVPVSAMQGDNVLTRSERMPWFEGPTLIEAMAAVRSAATVQSKILRLPVQAVLKFDDRRIIAGRIESGSLAVGDEIQVWPSGQRARVKSIESWPDLPPARTSAGAGESVGITLDYQLFTQRGDVIAHPGAPPHVSSFVAANLVWMGRRPLEVGARYRLRSATLEREVEVFDITRSMSAASMERRPVESGIGQHDVGEVILKAARPVVFDLATELTATGRFVLVDGHDVMGGGIVLENEELYRRPHGPVPRSERIAPVAGMIAPPERAMAYGHRSHVVWLTGMPGAGKSTVARLVERALFDRGVKTTALDGEGLRFGLSADLQFTDADRSEQARRAAEVARLFQTAGLVVVVALVSPFEADREYARSLIGEEQFTLVHLHAPLEVLRQRERHGLYARAGDPGGARVPGVSAAYESPVGAHLAFDTAAASPEGIVAEIVASVERLIHQ